MDILILLLPLLLLFFVMSRGRKQQRQMAELQASLSPGLEVITTAGLHARVVEVHDTTVVLEIAPGVRSTWARPAVARRVEAAAPAPDTAASPLGSSLNGAGAPDAADTADGTDRPER